MNLLRAKFTPYKDFHTMLYLCAAEFDFLSATTLYRLSQTLLLPSVYASLGLIAVHAVGLADAEPEASEKKPAAAAVSSKKQRNSVLRREKQSLTGVASTVSSTRRVDPSLLYNVLQLAAFVVMAALIMRLKLFMSPHLCITAGLLASRKVLIFLNFELKRRHYNTIVSLDF